jgi:Cu2+-exporting ATPase
MADSNAVPCYHCGLPVPLNFSYGLEILGEYRPVCCPGCEAVARAIVNGGYESFYDKRTETSQNLESEPVLELDLYDSPEALDRFVRSTDNDLCEATLTVSGINCGACLWLIESSLSREHGIRSALVNYTTRRALVQWDPQETSLRDILGAFRRIGFDASPYEYRTAAVAMQRDRDHQLRRIGISGVLGMQIMMIAVALYFGRTSGIAENFERFFEWISMLLVLPVVIYCAHPFYTGAWRGIRFRQATIDIPVTLGLSIAFLASTVATVSGSGDTYFEAISMFVFLLLATRYFEMMARERGLDAIAHIQSRLSGVANRAGTDDVVTRVPVARLAIGDVVIVGVGDGIPVDGVVLEGETRADESIVSGESVPIAKEPGSEVIGGSVNLDAPLRIRVIRSYDDSTISVIARLAEQAQSTKPDVVRLVDRIATGFVIGLIVVSALVAIYCWHYAPERLISTVIAVLVIACPCALSLATPAALSATVGALTRRGIILLNTDAIEKLTVVNRVVFDKTGTLTHGHLQLVEIRTRRGMTREHALSVANALELASSSHPVARALSCASDAPAHRDAQDLEYTAGGGVSGTVQGTRYRLGSRRFVRQGLPDIADDDREEPTVGKHDGPVIYLVGERETQACFLFSDELRAGAGELVDELRADGTVVSVLSGDRAEVVARIADELDIDDFHSQLTPQDKLDQLSGYQSNGDMVLAVGDGVNDAPLLSSAAVGIAMGSGADLARITGDVVLINSRLSDVSLLLDQARRTRKIVLQNFIWAIGYNILALPLGVLGLVPPWIAVIGMSISSLIVVLNALRLTGRGGSQSSDPQGNNRVAYA